MKSVGLRGIGWGFFFWTWKLWRGNETVWTPLLKYAPAQYEQTKWHKLEWDNGRESWYYGDLGREVGFGYDLNSFVSISYI